MSHRKKTRVIYVKSTMDNKIISTKKRFIAIKTCRIVYSDYKCPHTA